MDSSDSDRDPVEELAEEFVARYRRGERPVLVEYTDRFPQWADRIRALFPALVVMENVRPDPAIDPGGRHGERGAAESGLKRLGDYRILREVGRGGMGIVYEAEQESLGRHVALKVLPAQALLDPRHLQRFKREARAAARLHHTNIVPVHGVGEQDGMHYFVMQLIHGQGLDQVLVELTRLRRGRQPDAPGPAAEAAHPSDERGGELCALAVARSLLHPASPRTQAARPDGPPLPAGQEDSGSQTGVHLPGQAEGSTWTETGWQYWYSVAHIGIQVADALAYAFSQGVLHRDIKPSNLLLDTRGTVWVTDFGLAKAETEHDNVTHTGDVVGTLRYMAPERFSGKADVRSDVYALGLTLYELVTLRPAFDETDRGKLIAQVMHDQPPALREVEPAVPRDLETIVLKAIAREVDQRYQTPGELADDLRCFLNDRPITARRQNVAQRGWRWCRRNPAMAFLTAMVAVLLSAVTAGSWVALWRLQHEQEQTVTQLKRAENAEKDGRKRLHESYLALAQARRWSRKPGRHFQSLEVLQAAAAICPSLELRNEAIACIPLVDLRFHRSLELKPIPQQRQWELDPSWEHYAAGDDKGNIIIRRVADAREVARLLIPGEPSAVSFLRFSPCGKYLYAGYELPKSAAAMGPYGAYKPREPTAKPIVQNIVWNWREGRTVLTLAELARSSISFSPDGRHLAVGTCEPDGTILLCDLMSEKKVKRVSGNQLQSPQLVFHPLSRVVAFTAWRGPTIRVRDLDSGEIVATYEQPAPVWDFAWSPAGTVLAATQNRSIWLWDYRTHKCRARLDGHQDVVTRCAFNHRGDLLASHGKDGMTRLWDVVSGKELISMPGAFINFSADDRFLAYSNLEQVGMWEVATGRECRALYCPSPKGEGPRSVAFQPGGRLLSTTHDDGIRMWDGAGKEVVHLPAVNSRAAVFDPSGDWLFTSDYYHIRRWPLTDKPEGGVGVGPPQLLDMSSWGDSQAVSLSGDGQYLAFLSTWSLPFIRDLNDPRMRVRLDGNPRVSSVAISPDGQWGATGSQNGSEIKVWDARTGKLVREMPAGRDGAGLFSPDGKWLVITSHGAGTHICEVGTWKVRHALNKLRSNGMAISKDSFLLALSYEIGTVVLIDLMTGREIAKLPAPNPLPIGGMCFSDDGALLAAACSNHHTIQLWNLRSIRARLRAMNLDWEPAPDARRDRR
jgi:WD40 repeat protein